MAEITSAIMDGGTRLAELMAENGMLKAEKYSDHDSVEVYRNLKSEMNDMRSNILGDWVKPLAQEVAANRERIAVLETKVDGNKALQDKENEILRKEIEIANLKLSARIDTVAMTAKCGIDQLASAVGSINETIAGWRCGKIASGSICPPVQLRYNAYEVPTNLAPDTQPVTGNIRTM